MPHLRHSPSYLLPSGHWQFPWPWGASPLSSPTYLPPSGRVTSAITSQCGFTNSIEYIFHIRKRVKRPPTSPTGLVVKRCATREYELFFDSCARRVLRRHRLPHPCLRCQIPSHALSSGMAGSGKIRPFASKTRRPAIGWRIVRVLFHHSGDLGRSPPVRIGQWWRWHAICHDCMPSVRICR